MKAPPTSRVRPTLDVTAAVLQYCSSSGLSGALLLHPLSGGPSHPPRRVENFATNGQPPEPSPYSSVITSVPSTVYGAGATVTLEGSTAPAPEGGETRKALHRHKDRSRAGVFLSSGSVPLTVSSPGSATHYPIAAPQRPPYRIHAVILPSILRRRVRRDGRPVTGRHAYRHTKRHPVVSSM